MKPYDLLLINPSSEKKVSFSLSAIEPPIWVGLLASFIRENGYNVKIIDGDGLGLNAKEIANMIQTTNLIGICVMGTNPSASSTPKMPEVTKIVKELRNKNIVNKIFLYGIHPSALPEKTLKELPIDFICRGEYFYTVLDLLKNKNDIPGLWYKKNGSIVNGGWGKLIKDISILPQVAWDLLPMSNYIAHNWHCLGNSDKRDNYAVIYTSLGCPYKCKYCNIHVLYNGKAGIRYRSIDKVMEEIDLLVEKYNIKNLKILDELFVLKPKRVKEFCDKLIEKNYNLNIWAYARIDTIDVELLAIMKKAGINWLAYGIEAGDQEVRSESDKGQFKQDKIIEVVKMTKDAHINVMGNFIFGLPGDDLNSMRKTLNFAKKLNCEYINFYVCMNYPGSELYNNDADLSDNWMEYSQYGYETMPCPTDKLSPEEILQFRDDAFIEYCNNPEYLELIQEKFGDDSVDDIKKILKHNLKRKILE